MNRIVTCVAALAALIIGTPAFAADLSKPVYKAPPPPPVPVFSWTGFYVGGNVGYSWTNAFESTFADPFGAIPFAPAGLNAGRASGALGGVQVGWNWQFAPTWVLGIEGDFDWTSLSKSGTVTPLISGFGGPVVNSTFSATENVRDLASIRGRIGYAWNSWLAYFTGGGAWMDRHLSADAICPAAACGGTTFDGPVNFSQNNWGWVLGGGVEYKTGPWIFGVEYLYYRFENGTAASSPLRNSTGAFIGTTGCPTPTTQCFFYTFNDTNIQTVRARLSYQFDWGSPGVTRY